MKGEGIQHRDTRQTQSIHIVIQWYAGFGRKTEIEQITHGEQGTNTKGVYAYHIQEIITETHTYLCVLE
jgi:hypothetical protein